MFCGISYALTAELYLLGEEVPLLECIGLVVALTVPLS
jgi:hypothetical protein